MIFRLTSSADTPPYTSNVVRSQKNVQAGWNRDSFFFFFLELRFTDFGGKKITGREEREREEITDRSAKRLSEEEFLEDTGFADRSPVRSVVTQKIALSGYPVIRFCSDGKKLRDDRVVNCTKSENNVTVLAAEIYSPKLLPRIVNSDREKSGD